MQRRRIRFTGRVQGVGFRVTARAAARGLPISGWVRNEPDGSVLMEVQGPGEQIEAYLAGLRSRLTGLIVGEESQSARIVEGEASFEIRR
jgi:acylphosphatase